MEHFRVGGVRLVLRYANNITGSDLPHGLHKKLCAESFEPVKELPGRFKLADLRFARSDHVPGVHRRSHVLHGNTGRLVPIEHRPLNGRSAAVFRQERAMDIDAAVLCHVKKRLRQNTAVSHDHKKLRSERAQKLRCRAVLEGYGLIYGNAALHGQRFHRRKALLHAASPRLVRLRENRGNVLTGLEKRAQRFFRKVRRTHKNNSHFLSSPP